MVKHKYGDCSFCGGRVTEQLRQKPCFWGDKLVALIDEVPAGVCEQCGEQYYKAAVLKQIETQLQIKKVARLIRLPVIKYAA
jgi:YgiT-type zinc finger domain-containing protein